MAYPLPSLSQMQTYLVGAFRGAFPDRNVGSRFSFHWKLLKTFAGAITDLHAKQLRSQRETMPHTSSGDRLLDWCEAFKIVPKGATPARGTAALRVRGTVGATVSMGDQLVHRNSGLRFAVNQDVTMPAATFVDVDVVAIDVGSATRLAAGEVLEFLATPVNIQTKAELQLPLDSDGYDSEQEGALQARLKARIAEPSAGGNDADWVRWALAYTGIANAYVYPARAGIGSVDIVAMHAGNGQARVLTEPERLALQAYLAALAPSQLRGGALRVLGLLPTTANVTLLITPNGEAAYAFDWEDNGGAVVLSWNATTRLLTFTTTRPASMKAGDRIILAGGAHDGSQHVIEALSSTDAVVLQTVPTVAPANGHNVYAGGPLVDPIRNAVKAHLNGQIIYAGSNGPLPEADAASTVGLQILAEGVGPANPSGAYGPWLGALIHANLGKLATYTPGVRNVAIEAPAVDLPAPDYAFPADENTGFLVPGAIIVRKAD